MSPTGHLAIGFSAKRFAPAIPLFVFFIAAYLIDLLYFMFLLLGLDKLDYDPWSHSLFMSVIWSMVAGLLALILSRGETKDKIRNGGVIAIVVFSHWVLDFIVWDNLPVFFDKRYVVGLGLFDRIGFSITGMQLNSGMFIGAAIELGILAIGILIYSSYRKALKRSAQLL